ncbi:MAG: ABC transporter permease [Polyangiaceae bacterium]|nr:ABC transporter permease [Polyangiaceae bacterium]
MNSLLTALRLAFRAITRSALRSALTALGILVGVASVAIVVSLGRAATEQVGSRIQSLGSNVIYVFNRSVAKSGARGAAGTGGGLTEGDARAIAREVPSVSQVTVYSDVGMQVSSSFENTRTKVVGADVNYFDVRGYTINGGRNWTPSEELTRAKVCLIGTTAAGALFENMDPIGQTLRVGKHPYRVIGTLASKGQSPFGTDQDDRIVMPIGSFRARVAPSPGRRVEMIMASAPPGSESAAVRDMEALMSQRHHIAEGAEADFRVRSQAGFQKRQAEVLNILSVLLLSVAAIALFVGGVGVMNIMLVSVTERKREIGIRMAIGARASDIRAQFLAEAAAIALFGGVLGLALAGGLTFALSAALGWDLQLSRDAILTGLATSVVTGLLFGIWPAARAASLEPIEALRHE